jgi:hypothetical protein
MLDIIAHFRAGRIFNSKWFKAAGWVRIILAITLIIVILLIVLMIISLPAILPPFEAPYAALARLLALSWPLAVALLTDLLDTRRIPPLSPP